jgi:plastocyanin
VKRKPFTGNLIALSLVLLLILILHPMRAGSEEAKSAPAEVRVDNFTFEPQILTVPLNSTVTWVNKDDVPHVIASDDALFRSQALDTGDKYSYMFGKRGTYPYYCSVHPKMVGKIEVR